MDKNSISLLAAKIQQKIRNQPIKHRIDAALLFGLSAFTLLLSINPLLIIIPSLSFVYHFAHWRFERSRQTHLEKHTGKSQYSIEAISSLAFPSWWIPILNWNWVRITVLLLTIHYLHERTEFSFEEMLKGAPIMFDLFQGLLRPNLTHLSDAIYIYARQTIEVALLGTLIGFVIALPLSMMCANNIGKKGVIGTTTYYATRMIVTIFRALPTFLLGLIFVAMVGLGPFPGVLAISVFSAGIMVKLFSETFESLPSEMADVIKRCGGNGINVIYYHYIPKATPLIIAQTLYCVEINIHSATVLGLIGAEGIGLPIHEYLSAMAFSAASTYILVTVIMTVCTDYLSVYLRSKISP